MILLCDSRNVTEITLWLTRKPLKATEMIFSGPLVAEYSVIFSSMVL